MCKVFLLLKCVIHNITSYCFKTVLLYKFGIQISNSTSISSPALPSPASNSD